MRTLRVPEDYMRIQLAINAAHPRDTIVVSPGVYREQIIVNKTLTLYGQKNSVIEGYGSGIVVHIIASGVTMSGFTITKGRDGMVISAGSYSTFSNNVIANNTGYGVNVMFSCFNTFRNNSIYGNRYNFGVDGTCFLNDVDASNTVDGKPICYWINQADKQVPEDVGYVALINSENILVKNLNLSRNGEGILLVQTTRSFILNVSLSNNRHGIRLISSSNNTVSKSQIIGNRYGIRLSESTENTIVGNAVMGNLYGLLGDLCQGNAFDSNILMKNNMSISIARSTENNFVGNNVSENVVGISLVYSCNNTIHNNNFVNNKEQTYNYDSKNAWNGDYPTGGNFWSDHKASDFRKGPQQDEPGSDGIGDAPYFIDAENVDRYPLLTPLLSFTYEEL